MALFSKLTDGIDKWMSWIVHSRLYTSIQSYPVFGFLVFELAEDVRSETLGHPIVVFPEVWEVGNLKVCIAMLPLIEW